MIPIVASLMQAGLTTLGGAILEKGKQYVEEKLGIDLPDEDKPLSSDQLEIMRRLEFEHEEKLMAMRIESARISLEEQKAAYADTADARGREVKIATSPDAPLINKIIVPVLALVVVLGGGALLFVGDSDVRVAASSLISTVLGYFFGTSVGSREKQAVIDKLSGAQNEIR